MDEPLHKPGLPCNAPAWPRRHFPRVLATFADGREIRAIGREGATLVMLIENGPRGVRATDFPDGSGYRPAAYIHDLRRMGISIRREFERHATGSHAVYVLESRMVIMKVDEGARHE